ncbi:MAG: recombinase family protein, partial [Nitrosospira sp.]|nr:recombinase family protein [Nitrosospira sp.]
MALYGYARVSTSDQDFALQEQALRAAGCEVVRAEKMSGTSREGRIELQICQQRFKIDTVFHQ